MITPADARDRVLVRVPSGALATLVYCPPPRGEPVRSFPFTGRGAGRGRQSAVVVQDGRHYRYRPELLTRAEEEDRDA